MESRYSAKKNGLDPTVLQAQANVENMKNEQMIKFLIRKGIATKSNDQKCQSSLPICRQSVFILLLIRLKFFVIFMK